MFQTGLVSISFRQHTPEQITAAAGSCGLQAIEWGSDVHVPQGDKAAALRVRSLTEERGLHTAAYGSYFSLGKALNPEAEFAPYLQTAEWLGAPLIRIWGGEHGSGELTGDDLSSMIGETRILARMAESCGIRLALECHPGTLTDNETVSALFLLQVGGRALTLYWQPNQYRSYEENLRSARLLASSTTNLHVFSWEMAAGELRRFPLQQHEARWLEYLRIFASAGGHALLLEFMHDDRLETLPQTAAVLNRWAKLFSRGEQTTAETQEEFH